MYAAMSASLDSDPTSDRFDRVEDQRNGLRSTEIVRMARIGWPTAPPGSPEPSASAERVSGAGAVVRVDLRRPAQGSRLWDGLDMEHLAGIHVHGWAGARNRRSPALV
jgi:hypothetical protein